MRGRMVEGGREEEEEEESRSAQVPEEYTAEQSEYSERSNHLRTK